MGAIVEICCRPFLRYTAKCESRVNTLASGWISARRTRLASARDIGRSSYLRMSFQRASRSAMSEKSTSSNPDPSRSKNLRAPPGWRETRKNVSAKTGSQVRNGAGNSSNLSATQACAASRSRKYATSGPVSTRISKRLLTKTLHMFRIGCEIGRPPFDRAPQMPDQISGTHRLTAALRFHPLFESFTHERRFGSPF